MSRALIFPGQGAQYVGMGLDLAQRFPVARELLDRADRVLGFALSDVMAHGPDGDLGRTDVCQPAILVASAMSLAVLRQIRQPLPFAAVAGLSLGEYTALVAAGAVEFDAALRLVRLRGQAMQAAAEATASGMLALIGADEANAQQLCTRAAGGEVLSVANLNATGQVVIAGSAAAIARAGALVKDGAAKDLGIRKAIPLPVAGAFHTTLMEPAAAQLREALAATTFRDPAVPVFSNVTAAPVTKAAEIPGLLAAQLTQPVRFAASMQAMQSAGIAEFWELGPGKSLCGMASRTVAGVALRNLDTSADVPAFAAAAG